MCLKRRGTTTAKDLLVDLSWLVVTSKLEGYDVEVPSTVAMKTICIMKKLLGHIKQLNSIREVRFVGHSLGGALAQVLHLQYEYSRSIRNEFVGIPELILPPSEAITIGAPLVFCFRNAINEQKFFKKSCCANMHNLVFQLDPVRTFICI